jgi:U3 small nucleolar RNA-associated protein 19
MKDEFLPQENDPTKTRALQSSLWELVVLEHHYYSPISTLAKSIGTKEESKAPPHIIEEFSNHTFKSLFDQERKKRTQKTALTFQEPQAVFTENDVFAGILSFQ